MTRAFLTVLFAVAVAGSASAQTFRTDARPAGGTLQPRADRPAELLDLALRSGSETGMDDCPGYVDPSAPDAVVEWPGGGDLRITARSAFDATLVVARPDGTWACNDDGEGLSPVIEVPQAARGRYAVWVGSLGSDIEAGSEVTLIAGRTGPAPMPDIDARPSGRTTTLTSGFEARDGAHVHAVDAGGLDAVSPMDVQSDVEYGCGGYVDAAQPSLVVTYDGGEMLAFAASKSDEDYTSGELALLVHTPDGTWRCGDAYVLAQPALGIADAPSGTYSVWVGTYNGRARRGPAVPATLTVSETAPEADYGEDGPMGPFSEGTYTPLMLDERPAARIVVGDEPVEAQASVLASGPNSVTGRNCSGFLPSSPTADVVMAGSGPFGITASALDGSDLVMVVRTPSGGFFCSDDADGLNPGVQFGTTDDPTADAGTYRVWVGTFGDPSFSMDMEGMEGMEDMEMPATGPTAVVVRAARGEITVSASDFGDMDDMMDRPAFTEGTYDGTDLRSTNAGTTLRLTRGSATTTATAGGDLLNPVVGDACTGFLDPSPTLAFDAPAGQTLHIAATSPDDDLVMVVRAPSGQFFCSDDADGQNPAVDTSEEGRHAVWVGTFSRRPEGAAATVTVSPADGQ